VTIASWAAKAEGGSALALRLLLAVVLRLGPRAAGIVLPPLTAWYLLTAHEARAASRDYLARILGRPPRPAELARHFHSFAACLLDRVFLLAGRDAAYDIAIEGLDHVMQALKGGQGCILLGAHLGSFEVLRRIGHMAPVAVRPVMYRRNAGALSALLDHLAPSLAERIIDIGEPGSMLRAHEAVSRGEIVGLLADRAPSTEGGVAAEFLGARAVFPSGPFILAASLPAPVLLFFGLRIGPRRYKVQFLPFADRLVLPRAGRSQQLHAPELDACVARFASALEQACRTQPLNWFNFYKFWETRGDTHATQPVPAPSGPGHPGIRLGGGAADAA
jgi:predicted LPLAT superfamily acyltransferase